MQYINENWLQNLITIVVFISAAIWLLTKTNEYKTNSDKIKNIPKENKPLFIFAALAIISVSFFGDYITSLFKEPFLELFNK